MKAITGNRLSDGAVVYFTADGTWAEHLAEARFLEGEEADAALEEAKARVTEVASAYLMDAEADGRAAGRAVIRETIRNEGPTVRRDLGKQAERA